MKFVRVLKAKENEEVVKQRLEELAHLLDEEGSISYGEINYLQDHQEEVKKYFPNNSTMWQWADIPEEEWRDKKSSKHVKSKKWSVEKINENDWTIKSPDGMYKDENGKEYHFKTKEDALEELDYLRAEHKFDKKSKKVKSGESYGWVVNPEDAFDKLSLWVETVGAEAALDDLARAMGPDELSDNLAFIFRNNDFEEGCSDYEEEVDE